MRLLRGLPGAVLWILAAVLGLVGVLLCVTIILLPLGVLPREVGQPCDGWDLANRGVLPVDSSMSCQAACG